MSWRSRALARSGQDLKQPLRCNEVLVVSGTARDRRVPWVIRLYGALEGGVDREQRVGAGEFGDPVQRSAGPDHESDLSAPGGGFAVGPEQMPDG
jgi:hypothetical protein